MGGRGSGVPLARERIFRVNEFWQMIIDNEGKTKEEIIAKFSFTYGTERRTVLNYLKILILNKKIKEVDKMLWKSTTNIKGKL